MLPSLSKDVKHYLVDKQCPQSFGDIISDTDAQTAVIMAIIYLGIQMLILSYTLCHQQMVKEQK